MTGTCAASLAQRVTISISSGSWPTAAPWPRSDIPCGQPKFSSKPSTGTVSQRRISSCQLACVHSVISEATIARSGYAALHSAISRRFSSSGRSVMSSMLFIPAMRYAPTFSPAKREVTLTIGSSASVFHTAPPQPAWNARITW